MRSRNLYSEIKEDENVLVISIVKDVPVSELDENISLVTDKSVLTTDGDVVKAGTSIFVDKKSKAVIVKMADKNVVLMNNNEKLFIDFQNKGYVYTNGEETYFSACLTDEGKNWIFESIRQFMRNFRVIDTYLPIDSTITFMFLNMDMLDLDDVKILFEGNGLLLYLASFRNLNLKKLKLNVADAYTYELVGSIDLSLNKNPESNFSYWGNVSYKINSEHEDADYAKDVLRTLIEYVKTLSDEYNKELYISSVLEYRDFYDVVTDSGGVLEYDGSVPEGDSLSSLNKIKEVKIYKIDAKGV